MKKLVLAGAATVCLATVALAASYDGSWVGFTNARAVVSAVQSDGNRGTALAGSFEGSSSGLDQSEKCGVRALNAITATRASVPAPAPMCAVDQTMLAQWDNAGCNECKRRWAGCRNNCNTPFNMGPTYQQCMVTCDTAGQACMQRFCPGFR